MRQHQLLDQYTLTILASASSGNASLIHGAGGAIMIDCGVGLNYAAASFTDLKLEFSNILSVFLTHTHSDHIKIPLIKKLMRCRVPVYLHGKAREVCERFQPFVERTLPHRCRAVSSGPFRVEPFPVPHDSPGGCCGYKILLNTPGRKVKVTMATDLGKGRGSVYENFIDSDVIVIESNHDEKMLFDSGRPSWVKKRIKRNHLSNAECGGILRRVISHSRRPPKAVILAHLSRECNRKELALNTVRRIVGSMSDIDFSAARPDSASSPLELV